MDARNLSSETFEEQGYRIVPGLMGEDDLRNIELGIETVCRRDPALFQPGDLFFAGRSRVIQQIEHLERYSPYFVNLMKKERRILDLVEPVFDDEMVCENVSYMAKPPRIGAVVPWHQDNAYYFLKPDHALTVWVALDDSTPENGCLRVIAGSHKRGLVPHGPTGVRGISYGVAEPIDPVRDREFAIHLRRGDASLHHCSTYHSSHPNRSDKARRGLVMFYRAVHCRIDAEAANRYRKVRDAMLTPAR